MIVVLRADGGLPLQLAQPGHLHQPAAAGCCPWCVRGLRGARAPRLGPPALCPTRQSFQQVRTSQPSASGCLCVASQHCCRVGRRRSALASRSAKPEHADYVATIPASNAECLLSCPHQGKATRLLRCTAMARAVACRQDWAAEEGVQCLHEVRGLSVMHVPVQRVVRAVQWQRNHCQHA